MATARPPANDPRLTEVFEDLLTTLKTFIGKHRITHDEYRGAVGFLMEIAAKQETPLLCDVFLESTVDTVDSQARGGTDTSVEGPYYVPDAPMMKSPCVLPHRANEPGEVLLFSGAVRSVDGEPLAGAMLDLWQADAQGVYSHYNIPPVEAPFNLRARVVADPQGRFEVQTWVPAPYTVLKDGPTGALLIATGRHPWRPAHLHVRITHPAYRTLTTQIFFAGDRWLDSDVVGAVKPSLIVTLLKRDDPMDLLTRNLRKPYCAFSYDFALAPEARTAA